MSLQAVTLIWWVSIGLLLVVTGVVALLLTLVLRTARSILHRAGDIWTIGKLVANNTIHIPLLVDTNRAASAILDTAGMIAAGTSAIEQHAQRCPADRPAHIPVRDEIRA